MSSRTEEFAQLMRLPEGQLDLGLAALLIAEEEYPELEREPYLRQLDDLAAQARSRFKAGLSPAEIVTLLGGLLAEEEGFRGNEDDYYDPRNSFLNDVLERRTGIPITLTAVYIEVGRRAGLEVDGVGFPAHFLARHEDVIFDPFNGGRILSEDDCQALLAQMTSGSMAFQRSLLAPTPTRQIVARMLNNLKHIYLKARYYRKAVGIMDRLLIVNPNSHEELRDRGVVHAELKQYVAARHDLTTYLKHCKQPDEVAAVRQALQSIDNVLTLMDE